MQTEERQRGERQSREVERRQCRKCSALLSYCSTALPGLVLERDARRLPMFCLPYSFIHLSALQILFSYSYAKPETTKSHF